MKKKLRVIFVWSLVSLILQFGAYYYLNNQVRKVMAPPTSAKPITRQLKATIPGTDLSNVQVSYAKDYLAYMENGTLKVFNLKTDKVVFEKPSPSPNNKSMGVLTYQWLPDRNTLLYFYAKENPNPVTYVKVYPSTPVTQTVTESQTTVPIQPKTEDPHQSPTEKVVPKVVTKVVPAQPIIEKRYGNPQITELYSLELPNSDDSTPPNDRFNQTINRFPAGGKIENLVVSTFTNLMYLTVKSQYQEMLLEIDVMKDVSTINKIGETVDNIAASDRYGTLYFDSDMGGYHQIIALAGSRRYVISQNNNDRIIGVKNGKVYIGEVENNALVKIKTAPDLGQIASLPSMETEWEGSIPYNNNIRTLIGSDGQVIIYNDQSAYIENAGKLTKIQLHGEEDYVSVDGAELIQLTKEGNSTLAELQPLK
jgi:hypothetical protein